MHLGAQIEAAGFLTGNPLKSFLTGTILALLLVGLGVHMISLGMKGRWAKVGIEALIILIGLAYVGLGSQTGAQIRAHAASLANMFFG